MSLSKPTSTTPSGPGVPRGFFVQQNPARPPPPTVGRGRPHGKKLPKASEENLREFLRISDQKEALRRKTVLATLPKAGVGVTLENALCIPELDYGKLRKKRRQNALNHQYYGYGFSHRPTVEPFYSEEKPDELDATLFVVPPPWESAASRAANDAAGEGGEDWLPSEEHLQLVPEYMQVEIRRDERRMLLLMSFDPDTALWIEGYRWQYSGLVRDGVLLGIKRIVLLQRDETFGKSFLLGRSAEAKHSMGHRQMVHRAYPMMAELQEKAFAREKKRKEAERRALEEKALRDRQSHYRIMGSLERDSRGDGLGPGTGEDGDVGGQEEELTRPWYGPNSATSSTTMDDDDVEDEGDDEEEAQYRDEEDNSNVYEPRMTQREHAAMLHETLMDIQRGGREYREWLRRQSGGGPKPEG